MSLIDIVDNKGRISYNSLKLFISNCALHEFTEQAKHPFLVGKKLYDGEIKSKDINSNSLKTMLFDVSEIQNELDERYSETTTVLMNDKLSEDLDKTAGISQAVFMLRKKAYSTEPDKNTITIGRSQENDIVIPDFAVSKHHAKIVIFNDMYFIVDVGSTNGTIINGKAVPPQMKVQVSMNSMISFGRLCFVLTHPLMMYRAMCEEISGE